MQIPYAAHLTLTLVYLYTLCCESELLATSRPPPHIPSVWYYYFQLLPTPAASSPPPSPALPLT